MDSAKPKKTANKATARKPVVENEKVKELQSSLAHRKEAEKRAHETVLRLIDGEIEANVLKEAARFIDPNFYSDIVEERALAKICGYPVCGNTLPETKPAGAYRIDAKNRRVFDVSERVNFCSNQCYAASLFYQKQIPTSPVWLRAGERMEPIEVLHPNEIPGLVGRPVDLSGAGISTVSNQLDDLALDEHEEPVPS